MATLDMYKAVNTFLCYYFQKAFRVCKKKLFLTRYSLNLIKLMLLNG